MHDFGLLIRESRLAQHLTLDQLAQESELINDHIQKIESAKHGGILILTYARLMASLRVGLSFTKNNTNKKLISLSSNQEDFINNLFLDIPKDKDLQFLNQKPVLLLSNLGERVRKKRKEKGLTQKELAQEAGVSNTTIFRIENGKYDFRLTTLHKVNQALINFTKEK